jgi:PPM family protein phosphatase
VSAGEGARIQSAAQSDVGRSRTENQDAFGEFTGAAGERLFIVADGMGGHRGGATASRLCVETMGREFSESLLSGAERLHRGFELANARVHNAAVADPELSGMGTTAVALVLSPDGTATLGWVGDSRAYRFRDGALELLSSDHSVVGEMVRSGVLSPTEAESHPRRNELLRAIGPRPEVEAETRILDHQLGDRFLLCTDGLWGPVPEAELGVVLGYEAPDLAVRKLVGKANERGGPDNVTVQIVWLADPHAAALPVPEVRPVAAPRRSLGLPVLAGSAAAIVALILALTFYAMREAPSVPANEPTAPKVAVAPVAPAAPPAAASEPSAEVTQAIARAAEAKAAAARAAEAKAAEAKAAQAKAEAKAAKAKLAEAKAAEAKAAEAKAAEAKAAEAKAAEAAAAVVVPPAEPAKPEPEVAKVEPAQAAPPSPATVEPSAVPAEPKPPEPAAAATPQRAEVEHFLSRWENAIASRDFALYSSLGLPGNEQSFRSNYVDSQAKLTLGLRDVEQVAPDQLVVRVQMVLERTGSERIDEERKVLIRQTATGLRYSGPSD